MSDIEATVAAILFGAVDDERFEMVMRELGPAMSMAGHRTTEPHDCFAMNCRALGSELDSLREAAAEPQPSGLHQKAVDALVRRIADLDIRAWQRDGEGVVTIARSDIDKLLSITARARQLTRTRQRIGRTNR